MSDLFSYQKRIGIVGTTPDAYNFINRANNLGFQTYHLLQKKEGIRASLNADKIFMGSIDSEMIQEEFLKECDLLVYFDDSISPEQLEEISKTVAVPQGADLLAIAHDRVLQKAFKESLSVNIAPFQTIVEAEDIKKAIPSIGYPAVLKTNFTQLAIESDSYFIYEESDIEKASELLKYGTCVLESWIVSEHQLSITVVKTASNLIQFYPIIKKNYRNEQLVSIEEFMNADEEMENEMKRVVQLLAENISFIGAITIDFIISPAHAIYIGDIHPYPNVLSRYSEGCFTNSIMDAHLRAVTSLPVAEGQPRLEQFIYVPIYIEQKDLVEEWMENYPEWILQFYPVIKAASIHAESEIGHLLIETQDIEETKQLLKQYDL